MTNYSSPATVKIAIECKLIAFLFSLDTLSDAELGELRHTAPLLADDHPEALETFCASYGTPGVAETLDDILALEQAQRVDPDWWY